jgi:hypothetical protein
VKYSTNKKIACALLSLFLIAIIAAGFGVGLYYAIKTSSKFLYKKKWCSNCDFQKKDFILIALDCRLTFSQRAIKCFSTSRKDRKWNFIKFKANIIIIKF